MIAVHRVAAAVFANLKRSAAAALAAAAFWAGCAALVAAEPSLVGRSVAFRVLTIDAERRPLFEGRSHVVPVGEGYEFGMGPEGAQNGVDVVPVRINVSDRRIEFDYALTAPGRFLAAAFNGYELRFAADCALLEGARLDRGFSTLPIRDEDVSLEQGALYLNVSGLDYDRASRFAVDLEVADCPIS